MPPEAFLPSAGLPFVLTQKEAKSQEASKSCPTDHSAVSARAREACTSEKPSFSLPKLQTFRLGYGAFGKFENHIYPNALLLRSAIPLIEYHRDPFCAIEREIEIYILQKHNPEGI